MWNRNDEKNFLDKLRLLLKPWVLKLSGETRIAGPDFTQPLVRTTERYRSSFWLRLELNIRDMRTL